MTAKKDLKKKKSKKKVNKAAAKNSRFTKNEKPEVKKVSLDVAVEKDRKIAIVSLVQTSLVMAISVVMLIARPGSKFGMKVLSNNILIHDKFLLPGVMIAIEALMAICMIVHIYKTFKVPKLRKFYNTGILISGIALVYCMTQSFDKFEIYSYGVIIALIITILQGVKVYYALEMEKKFKDSEFVAIETEEN